MDDVTEGLRRSKCAPCEGGTAPLTLAQIQPMLKGLQGWSIEAGMLTKTFRFKNYYETMAFVNAAAWISHREDHHPDMLIGYSQCKVSYVTHSIEGLSANDFICAAKLDALFEL
jgi:4a-hydroxytetrahydrobiopterin dehydratase